MARKASSKPDSESSSTATSGFEVMTIDQPSGEKKTAKGSPQGERGCVHQFYMPSCVVRCLVEMLAPYKGRIYDPACGSGGMFACLPAMRSRMLVFCPTPASLGLGLVRLERGTKLLCDPVNVGHRFSPRLLAASMHTRRGSETQSLN